MIGYLRRTLPVLIRAATNVDGSLVSQIDSRVRARQVDLNLHMNQAAYAQVMELGRTDWMVRTGAFRRWRRQGGAKALVVQQDIVYRRELKPFGKFTIDTRAVGVQGRILVTETHLFSGEIINARGRVSLLFVDDDGVVDADRVIRLCAGLVVEPLSVVDWRRV